MIKDFKVSEVYKHLSIHDDADTLQVYVYEDDGKPAPISIQEEEFIQAPSPGMRIRDVSNFILNRRKGYFFLRASFLILRNPPINTMRYTVRSITIKLAAIRMESC